MRLAPPLAPDPLPGALRLACARPGARAPRPPFGLRAWSQEPTADLAVLLDLPESWPASGYGDAALVAVQVPPSASLPRGRLVVVLPRAPEGSWLARLRGGAAWAAGGVRASALLARGYTRLGAGVDPETAMDLVWGFA